MLSSWICCRSRFRYVIVDILTVDLDLGLDYTMLIVNINGIRYSL